MVIVFFTVVFKTFSEANSLPHLCIYMAAGDFTLIRDLDVLKDIFTMKLRVIRLWTLDSYYNKNELFFVELILMDEEIYFIYLFLLFICLLLILIFINCICITSFLHSG